LADPFSRQQAQQFAVVALQRFLSGGRNNEITYIKQLPRDLDCGSATVVADGR
jgi:hypothetical protein